MTISKTSTLPNWLITIIVSVLSAGFVAWGTISAINVKVTRSEKDIQEKVDRKEFIMLYNRLDDLQGDVKDLSIKIDNLKDEREDK